MRTVQVVMSVISTLLIAFTLICGFWIHNGKEVTDLASSVRFHTMLGIATGVSVLITTIITLLRK